MRTEAADDSRSLDEVQGTSRIPAPTEQDSVVVTTVYRELRKIAARYMGGERREHTLQPTAVVNEAYLHLLGNRRQIEMSRDSFVRIAAHVMRHVLVDHARRHHALKRGGHAERVELTDRSSASFHDPAAIIALHEALDELSRLHEVQAQVVELKYFGQLSEAEIAAELGIGERTVRKHWQTAKAFLHSQLSSGRTL